MNSIDEGDKNYCKTIPDAKIEEEDASVEVEKKTPYHRLHLLSANSKTMFSSNLLSERNEIVAS